jgi:hypothetical protein
MANWNIVQRFGEFYGHLVHFVSIGTFFMFLVSCTRKKSGNPDSDSETDEIEIAFEMESN